MRTLFLSLLLIGSPMTVFISHAADDAAAQLAQAQANEQRVRDTLRTTTQQLRAVEAEKASLLAGQTERDEKIAAMEAQVAKLTKQSIEDKAQSDKLNGELKSSLLRQEQQSVKLSTTLDKWKAAYQQAASVAKKTEAARSSLDAKNISLEHKVAEREAQNLELYKTAKEILKRYSDFSLGRSIAAKEPFTGLAKARVEELVQGYADKVEDQKLKAVPSDGKPSTKPAQAGPPAASQSTQNSTPAKSAP
jgi:septal ring factor EnvC (AmiA/AmiB activator)